MLAPPKKLVISRRRWYRGKGGDGSKLLVLKTRQMCCLGFYFRKCGFKAKEILNDPMPSDVTVRYDDPRRHKVAWLLLDGPGSSDSKVCERIANDNDEQSITDVVREARIKHRFAKYGVEVEFVD